MGFLPVQHLGDFDEIGDPVIVTCLMSDVWLADYFVAFTVFVQTRNFLSILGQRELRRANAVFAPATHLLCISLPDIFQILIPLESLHRFNAMKKVFAIASFSERYETRLIGVSPLGCVFRPLLLVFYINYPLADELSSNENYLHSEC